jgi:hypothetical protein
MITSMLYVRWQQIKRELASLGPLYFFMFVFIAWLMFMGIKKHCYQDANSCWGVVLLQGALLVSLHQWRPDKRLLYNLSKNYWLVFALEYLALSLIFLLGLIAGQSWLATIGLVSVCVLVALIPLKTQSTASKPLYFKNLYPPDYFEWIGGTRRLFIPMLCVYVLGFVITLFYPYAILLTNWFMLSFYSSFYDYSEPLNVLRNYRKSASPAQFLWQKIKRQTVTMALILLPPLAWYRCFWSTNYYILVAISLLMCLLIPLFIVIKYMDYEPDSELTNRQILIGFCTMSVLIPFFWPAPFFLFLLFYPRAIRNLSNYLGT